jgi:TRAP-type C4-dicarboxylate transport system permease small subunit
VQGAEAATGAVAQEPGAVAGLAKSLTEPAPAASPVPRAVRVLVGLEELVSAALVVALFALVLAQVVSRYLFGKPLVWSEELARFSLIWLTFVGSAFVMSYRRHIVVSLFRLSDRAWLALETASSAIMVVVILTILPAGVEFVQSNLAVRSAAARTRRGRTPSPTRRAAPLLRTSRRGCSARTQPRRGGS